MEYTLQTEYRHSKRVLLLTLNGILGSVGDIPLTTTFREVPCELPPLLALDIGGASMITSHGIRQLLEFQTYLKKEKVTLWLICSNPFTLELLRHLSLQHLFIIKPALPETF